MADDFHFTSPVDNRLDRDTYFRVAAGLAARSSPGSTSFMSSRIANGVRYL
jgi:hypothetical protein